MLSSVKKIIFTACAFIGLMTPHYGFTDPSQDHSNIIQRYERVSKKMIEQWEKLYPELKSNITFEVKFIPSPINNAHAILKNKKCEVIVFTGIWNEKDGLIKQNNNDEFAAILGHEMGHCYADHQGIIKKSLSEITLLKESSTSSENGIKAYSDLLLLKRSFENAADAFGIQLMEKSGFNPWSAVNIWERAIPNKNQILDDPLLNTHPSATERAERVRRLLESKITKHLRNQQTKL